MTGAIHQYYTNSLNARKKLTRGNNYSLWSSLVFLEQDSITIFWLYIFLFVSPEISLDLLWNHIFLPSSNFIYRTYSFSIIQWKLQFDTVSVTPKLAPQDNKVPWLCQEFWDKELLMSIFPTKDVSRPSKK